jgi:hypothetical protein
VAAAAAAAKAATAAAGSGGTAQKAAGSGRQRLQRQQRRQRQRRATAAERFRHITPQEGREKKRLPTGLRPSVVTETPVQDRAMQVGLRVEWQGRLAR